MRLKIVSKGTLQLNHYCNCCKKNRNFVSSNKFRMNANGKNIDVYLIYKCENCKTTFNLEIFERINISDMGEKLHASFLANDYKTACAFAYNIDVIRSNKCTIDYSAVQYEIIKECIGEEDIIEIISEYDLNLRIDKVLSKAFGISRLNIRRIFEDGTMVFLDSNLSYKSKMNKNIYIKVNHYKIK